MHHILQKNKRLQSTYEKPNRPPSATSTNSTYQSKQSQGQAHASLSSHQSQAMHQTVTAIEKGPEASQTMESLQYYVKTSNDYALQLINQSEFKYANKILHQCEQVLVSGMAGDYPSFNFQTFNNLAHCNNVQGNVRLSLKYLLRALEYGKQEDNLSETDEQQLPLVETYLNIANAFSFLTQFEKAIEYINEAIDLSQSCINSIMQQLEDPNVMQQQKEALTNQYHSQISLHTLGYLTKGSILEKLREYEEAIQVYQHGKSIIEANYGTQHKSYMEFINAINGAKLKTKYLNNSNLPKNEILSTVQYDGPLNIQTAHNNRFIREQDMVKPINQQKRKKKRQRPSSAKQNNFSSSKNLGQKGVNQYFGLNHVGVKNLRRTRVPNLNASTQSWNYNDSQESNLKESSQQQLSNRANKNAEIKIRPGSAKQKKKLRGLKMRTENSSRAKERSNSNSSQSELQQSFQNQLEQMKQFHEQQQKMMNNLLQQQMKQQEAMMNMTQQQQQQPQTQPPQFGFPPYPYPPPPNMYPPPPYGFPPQMPGYPPFPYPYPQTNPNPQMNNYMQSSLGSKDRGSSPDSNKNSEQSQFKEMQSWHQWNQQYHQQQEYLNQQQKERQPQLSNQKKDLPPRPPQFSTEKINNQSSAYSDLNERDSDFNELNTDRQYYYQKNNQQPQLHKIEEKKPQKVTLFQKMKAAIVIQKYFRGFKERQYFKQLVTKDHKKQPFHRQLFTLRKNQKQRRFLLVCSILSQLSHQNGNEIPKKIAFEFYDYKKKKVELRVAHDIADFGIKNPESIEKSEIIQRVQNFIKGIQLTNQPKKDIENALLNAKTCVNYYEQITFESPQYNEQPNQVYNKETKFEARDDEIEDEYSIQQDEEINEEVSEQEIEEEEIQDEYSQDHESYKQSKSDKDSSPKQSDKQSSNKKSDKGSSPKSSKQPKDNNRKKRMKSIIMIQSNIRKYLAMRSFEMTKQQNETRIIARVAVKKENDYYLVVARKNKGKSYSYTCLKQTGKKCAPAQKTVNELPCEETKLEDYIRKRIDIYFNLELQQIVEFWFKTDEEVKKNSGWFSNSEMVKAAKSIQRRARNFLSGKRKKAERSDYKIICSYIYKEGKKYAHVVVKQNAQKDQTKYKLIVRNVRKNRNKVHKTQLKKLPMDIPYLKAYLRQTLTIKWDSDGEQIKNIEIDDSKAFKDQIIHEMDLKMHEETEIAFSGQNHSNKKQKYEEEEDYEDSFEKQQQFKHQKKTKNSQLTAKELALVIKVQCKFRQYLAKKQLAMLQDGFQMVKRMCRRLSNGKLYHIFLMQRLVRKVQSTQEPFYIVTVRDIRNINDIYDLELSLDMARRIFGDKKSSKEELQRLVMYNTNQEQFILMLECLDINDGEFALNYKKFQKLKQEVRQNIDFVGNNNNQNEQIEEDEEYSVDEDQSQNVIEEIDSRYEESPENLRKQATSKKQEQSGKKMSKKKAAVIIQKNIRKLLARQQLLTLQTAIKKGRDPREMLQLKEQSIFKVCKIYFRLLVFCNEDESIVKFTLKAVHYKLTIISMKQLALEDFEESVEIFEIPDFIKDTLQEHAEGVILDEDTGSLKRNWHEELKEFIEENL